MIYIEGYYSEKKNGLKAWLKFCGQNLHYVFLPVYKLQSYNSICFPLMAKMPIKLIPQDLPHIEEVKRKVRAHDAHLPAVDYT